LIQKNQKIKSAEMLLFPTGLCPANQAKPRAANNCPTSFAHAPLLQIFAMPLQPHKATIVLPDFGRSCSADGEEKINK